jgi:hypothetical protein
MKLLQILDVSTVNKDTLPILMATAKDIKIVKCSWHEPVKYCLIIG